MVVCSDHDRLLQDNMLAISACAEAGQASRCVDMKEIGNDIGRLVSIKMNASYASTRKLW